MYPWVSPLLSANSGVEASELRELLRLLLVPSHVREESPMIAPDYLGFYRCQPHRRQVRGSQLTDLVHEQVRSYSQLINVGCRPFSSTRPH